MGVSLPHCALGLSLVFSLKGIMFGVFIGLNPDSLLVCCCVLPLLQSTSNNSVGKDYPSDLVTRCPSSLFLRCTIVFIEGDANFFSMESALITSMNLRF